MGHGDGAHSHGGGGGGADNLEPLVTIIAIVGGIILFVIPALLWVLHILMYVALAVGSLAIGSAISYGAFLFLRWRGRRIRAMTMLMQGYQPPPVARGRQPQFILPQAAPEPQQQALPAAQVHHHHGHTLSLPNVTADDLARLMKRQSDA